MGAFLAIAVLLLVSAAFNVFAWPTFFRRVARDSRARDEQGRATRFYMVHLVLLVVALVIAAAELVAGVVLVFVALAIANFT